MVRLIQVSTPCYFEVYVKLLILNHDLKMTSYILSCTLPSSPEEINIVRFIVALLVMYLFLSEI